MKKILDHGYLTVVEHWGSDERIVEAARMSTDKGFLGWGDPLPPCGYCGAGSLVKSKADNAGEYGYTCRNCYGTIELDPSKIPKSGDEKLLRTLWENKHATPFEMGGLIVEVQAPTTAASLLKQLVRYFDERSTVYAENGIAPPCTDPEHDYQCDCGSASFDSWESSGGG